MFAGLMIASVLLGAPSLPMTVEADVVLSCTQTSGEHELNTFTVRIFMAENRIEMRGTSHPMESEGTEVLFESNRLSEGGIYEVFSIDRASLQFEYISSRSDTSAGRRSLGRCERTTMQF